jgi:hypothetical protein
MLASFARMKTEEYNKGVSFRVPHATYRALSDAVAAVPGVVFSKRRRFFWSVEDVGADFTFRGIAFEIETDQWDGALWILPKDQQKHESEIQELREAVEKFTTPDGSMVGFFRRILSETFS